MYHISGYKYEVYRFYAADSAAELITELEELQAALDDEDGNCRDEELYDEIGGYIWELEEMDFSYPDDANATMHNVGEYIDYIKTVIADMNS